MTLPTPTLQAEVTYPTTGSAGPFAVPFPYLDKSHVKVYVDEVLTSLYTWPTAATILFNSVPAGSFILFRRETPTAPLVVVPSGSINPSDINTLANQAAYLTQEVQDQLAHSPRIMNDPMPPISGVASAARLSKFLTYDAAGNFAPSTFNSAQLTTLITTWLVNPVNSTAYIPPYAGSAARTIGDRLGDYPTIRDFGARPTAGLNNLAAINAALAINRVIAIPDDGEYEINGVLTPTSGSGLIGAGAKSRLKQTGASTTNLADLNAVTDVQFRNFQLTGTGRGIACKTGSDRIKIDKILFFGSGYAALDMCVQLATCTNVEVTECHFKGTGYGIIQLANVFSGLRVQRCIAEDMQGDFLELNGAGSLGSNIDIGFNHFLGSHLWNTPATEARFVGLTSNQDVRIHHNYVKNCAGDAAVHLEDIGGRILLEANEFTDCNVSGGNDAYVYLLSSIKTLYGRNNIFRKTDALAGTVSGYGTSSGTYSNDLSSVGDVFLDESASGTGLNAFNLENHSGKTLIEAATMLSGNAFILAYNTHNKSVIGNRVVGAQNGIYSINVDQAGGGGGDNWDIRANHFDCASYNLRSGKNTGGTLPPNKWNVTGNTFKCSSGTHLGVLVSDLVQGFGSGNSYGSNLTNTTIAASPGANTVEKNDFKEGTGLIHP